MKIVGGADLKDGHLISFLKNSGLHDPEFAMKIGDFADICDPKHHRQAVEDALTRMTKEGGSMGGQLAHLARAAADLDIVCWPDVPGEFLAPEEAHRLQKSLDRPAIMWNPYGTFAYFATDNPPARGLVTKTLAQLKSPTGGGMKSGDVVAPAPTVSYKANLMPAWVVLAHEIGHYRQYKTRRDWFLRCLESQDINAIERDNLATHEEPILKSIGLQARASYQDFKGGTNDTSEKHIQWDSLPHGDARLCSAAGPDLKVATAAFENKLALQKAKKQKHDATLQEKPKFAPMGKTVCPRCGKLVGNKNLDKPCGHFLHA